jgi:hypothetical protein
MCREAMRHSATATYLPFAIRIKMTTVKDLDAPVLKRPFLGNAGDSLG